MRGRSRAQVEALLRDEANLADTFLHCQDRAYSVPELYRFVEDAGLSLVSFTNFSRLMRLEYEPEIYLDPALSARLDHRPARERHAIAELLHGHMFVHAFYAARPGRAAASFLDGDMVPFFLNAGGAEAAERMRERGSVNVRLSSRVAYRVAPCAETRACLALVDGARSLEAIWGEAARLLGKSPESVAQAAAPELERFNALNWLCLRARACPPPPNFAYGYRGDAAQAE
jgi:hypothetical protein